MPQAADSEGSAVRSRALFSDDSLFSYFRRLDWSPDGTFLVTPTGEILYRAQRLIDTAALLNL